MTEPDPRPTPVLDAAKLGGLVGAAFVTCGGVYFLVAEGITRDNLGIVGAAVTAAVTALVALAVYGSAVIHGRVAQAQVTPTSDPRDASGQQLVPLDPNLYGRHATSPLGFPLDTWDAFAANPYSKPKMRAAVAAVTAWLGQ